MLREFGEFYYPTLIIRPDEMRGLNELPSNEKDLIFPIFQLCPWVGSAQFSRTFDKIQDVYPERPAIFDLDRSFYNWAERDSVVYFRGLIHGDEKAQDWVELIQNNEYSVPCLQFENHDANEIAYQRNAFVELGRGVVFKFRPHTNLDFTLAFASLETIYDLMGPTYLSVIIDVELFEDENIAQAQIQRLLSNLARFEGLRIVISSASFPSQFGFVDGVETVTIKSRTLFARIRREYNELNLSYSDWGSTKPRRPGFGTPLERIDYPMSDNWVLARSKSEEWDYMDAAQSLVASEFWQNPPNIWGVQMIELAARRDSFAINTRPKSASARVNIHLFVQSHYGVDAGSISTEEPWVE